MVPLLLRFEAIESRIPLYSCPRGTSGRVHSLRLRRCFRSIPPRASAVAPLDRLPLHEEHDGSEAGALALQGLDPWMVEERHKDIVGHNASDERSQYLRDTVPRYGKPRYHRMRRAIVPADKTLFHPQMPSEGLQRQEETILYSGLRTGNHNAVMRSLMNLIQLESHGYPSLILVSAPPPTFSEILRCIDPKHFIDPYAQVFREISSVSTHLLGGENVLGSEDYYEFCSAFLSQAGRIMDARRQRWPLTVSDYKYLLKCAKSVGHAKAAEKIWKTMTTPPRANQGQPVVPDAEAFNHFLAVKCWQDKMNPKQRYRLRVIEENFTPRSWLIPPHTLNSHRVGVPGGIKAQASRLFRQMVELGVTGNEETFCLMIVALGRESDMPGIASILNRVWNIDIEAIMTKDDADVPPPTAYSQRSPFFPSSHLLYSIAHAYGSNNDISTALRLLDYVSRNYSISIPLNVWNELLQWTAILSVRKRLVRKKDGLEKDTGRDTGQLPSEAVSNLWQTMTSEPYNVKPTIQMYNRLMTNLLERQRYGEMQWRMEEARKVLKDEIRVLGRKEAAFIAVSGRNNKSLVEARARDLIYTRFRAWRNRQYVKRWVRLLISRGSRSLENNDKWSQQNIPKIVHDWIVFLPNRVKYPSSSGEVSFWSGTNSVKKWRAGMLARRARQQAKTMAMWKEVDDFADEPVLGENEADVQQSESAAQQGLKQKGTSFMGS
ncbi:hypothetical protein EG329_014061 [Mollisiaceae sp. DMI_Dod_QoI]|nr:hypothetical protein EG329_014061 [Helotiales sp. DMI_Dod_QoI]